MRRYAQILSSEFHRKSALCSVDINAGDNNPLPQFDDSSSISTVPRVVEVSIASTPVSTMTMDEGQVVAPPPAIEQAPMVPEHFRKQHRFIKKTNKERRVCSAYGCYTKAATFCLDCKLFYCNGEGINGLPRFCFYAHVCHCLSGDINDPQWLSKLQQWETNRHKSNKK